LMECYEDQKMMEKQKYLPMRSPLMMPVCAQKYAKSLEQYFPLIDSQTEKKERDGRNLLFNTGDTDSLESKGGGDCPKHSRECPPAMISVVVNVGVCDDPGNFLASYFYLIFISSYSQAN